MSTTPITIRLDDDLRKELDVRLKAVGISLNTYVTMAAKQLVIQNRIPFDVVAAEKDEPNEVTKRAMVLAEAKDLGLLAEDSLVFSDVDQMMDYLASRKVN